MKTETPKISGNAPVKKFRAGSVTATVWKNTGEGKDGKKYEFLTVAIKRSYKDAKGEWKETDTYRLNDLPKVHMLSMKAYDYLFENPTGNEDDE